MTVKSVKIVFAFKLKNLTSLPSMFRLKSDYKKPLSGNCLTLNQIKVFKKKRASQISDREALFIMINKESIFPQINFKIQQLIFDFLRLQQHIHTCSVHLCIRIRHIKILEPVIQHIGFFVDITIENTGIK